MDDSIKFSSVLEPHDEAYRQELSDNSIAGNIFVNQLRNVVHVYFVVFQ